MSYKTKITRQFFLFYCIKSDVHGPQFGRFKASGAVGNLPIPDHKYRYIRVLQGTSTICSRLM